MRSIIKYINNLYNIDDMFSPYLLVLVTYIVTIDHALYNIEELIFLNAYSYDYLIVEIKTSHLLQ